MKFDTSSIKTPADLDRWKYCWWGSSIYDIAMRAGEIALQTQAQEVTVR